MNTDQLQALLEEATPLPWARGTGSRLTVWADRHCIFEDSFKYARLADADLIVAAVNALPEILLSLGSDETGAKPVDVHAPSGSAQPSNTTDSSPSSSREARHGVAAALVEKINVGLTTGWRFQRAEALEAAQSLLRLIDELADRLYELAATVDRRQGTIDKLTSERDAAYPLIAALAVYGEGVNLEALVAKARELNQAVGAGE